MVEYLLARTRTLFYIYNVDTGVVSDRNGVVNRNARISCFVYHNGLVIRNALPPFYMHSSVPLDDERILCTGSEPNMPMHIFMENENGTWSLSYSVHVPNGGEMLAIPLKDGRICTSSIGGMEVWKV